MAPTEPRERLYVREEKAIEAGPFKGNFKTLWAVSLGILCVVAIVFSSVANVVYIGLTFTFLVFVAYVLLFGIQPFEGLKTTASAKGFRSGNHAYRGLRGQNRHTSDQPQVGEVFGVPNPTKKRKRRPKPVKRIGRVDFIPHEIRGGTLGVAWDHPYNTYSSTMWVAGSSLHSDNPRMQMDRLQGFAMLLDQMAEIGSPVHRFKWREQTLLGEQQYPEHLVQTIRDGAMLDSSSYPNEDVLLRRTAEMGRESVIHRTTMSLSVYAPHVKREAKAVGGAENVLVQQLKDFYGSAMGTEEGYSPIGLKAATFLTYNELVLENRLALDPVFAQPYWQEWPGPEDDDDRLSEYDAWPGYVNLEHDDYCRLGETYHMGFYIEEFPRQGMLPDQFWNILKLRIPKTVTTVFEMVPIHRAERRAQYATSGARGSNVDRAQAQRRVTESQMRTERLATEHEREIAEQTGQVGRIRCYIDLTGASLEEVRANAQTLRGATRDARFIIEPLVGRQHVGIEAVMPTGRGLATIPVPEWA
jgi:hypothetical protein